MAVRLRHAGHEIGEIATRAGAESRARGARLARKTGAKSRTVTLAKLDADVIWLAVPDGEIARCAEELAATREWEGKTVVHSSGALASDALDALRRRGAATASVHPMMTFVAGEAPELKGVWFAVEGDAKAAAVASRLVKSVGGHVSRIRREEKALYHTFGALLSPLLVAELAAAERVGEAAGLKRDDLRKVMRPIVLRTVENYLERGGAAAFSGPLVRGDVETIQKHVRALKKSPDEKELYKALARYALKRLPSRRREAIRRALLS